MLTQRHDHVHADMLGVEEALERILSHFHVLEAEEKPILEALGQVLAEDVTSDFDIPPMDNSAMDGYAVQFDSIKGATPKRPRLLKVRGYVAAGQLPKEEVLPGTAVRIMTGAPVPPGTDTIVPFEDTDEVERKQSDVSLSEIGVTHSVPQGTSIRRAGEDIKRGQVALTQGTVLRPGDIGVLASLGYSKVKVIRRPVVAIIATGDELLEPGESSQPGKIYDSNSYSLASAVLRYGGIPRALGIARDNLESMKSRLQEGLEADFLLTSAGVSKGDYDIVKDVLALHGRISFWSVRMRPAKPLAFGVLHGPRGRDVPHLGLPGNPVSSLVAFEEFARPAIYKMMGKSNYSKPTIEALLEEPIHNVDGRRVYARVVVTKQQGRYYARLTGNQGSNILTSMARANGLAICPEDIPEMKAGQVVKVEMLDWMEDVF
ncbi:MAG: molybdopterin molybdotransferase MoeA [Chloroflexi bacterium]|nr:molybdopterin molybdotransferase MoeA [Chloroflexota bacterium]